MESAANSRLRARNWALAFTLSAAFLLCLGQGWQQTLLSDGIRAYAPVRAELAIDHPFSGTLHQVPTPQLSRLPALSWSIHNRSRDWLLASLTVVTLALLMAQFSARLELGAAFFRLFARAGNAGP